MGGKMPKKSVRLLTTLAIIALVAFAVSGCGKFGNRFENQSPTIRITSYEGYDDSALLAPYANVTFLFQQRIYWQASDPDGIIAGFAYRIKNQSGVPVATPGNDYIDMDGSVTPQKVVERFGTGWVIHYKPNANQDLALDDPNASRTIWTSQKYATINFPAADANGNPLTMNSTFEVIAIDNRGDVTPIDPGYTQRSSAWRSFNVTSARPTCNITTTKGNPGGGAVGSGIRLDFIMHDTDPFISETPYKFEFKTMKVDKDSGEIIAGTESQWYNSVSATDPELDKYLLTRYTTPALSYDIVSGDTLRKTQIFARTYDMAGVVSEVTTESTMQFAVKDGFRPQTLIYPQRVYALGDYHYIDYSDESTPEILPFTIIGGVQRYATPFFNDLSETNTAINSNNIKVWLRWGWHGEYAVVPAAGPVIYTDNPYDKKVDTVLDGDTDENYFSEVTNFDIRLDEEPYNYPPYANSHVTDGDGKEWLRIPVNSPLGQTLVLTSLTNGVHTLEVRCVDLQGEVDPNPAVYSFNLVSAVQASQRSGVLIVDDDRDVPSNSPEPAVTNKYVAMLADYSGTKTYVIKHSSLVPGDTHPDYRDRNLAPSDLQNYKLVIYHSDNPSESGELKKENDGITLYMRNGGNFLISHTSKLAAVLDAFVLATQRTFLGYFGVTYISPPAAILGDALNRNTFFQQAVGQTNYPNIDLQYGITGQPDASFNPLVNNLKGLSTITYFPTQASGTDIIYRMGIKPVGFTPGGPTQAQFDTFNNQPIGLRKVTNGSNGYMFGFPLSYMQADDAKAMMNQILSEIM
jgi:hypothetical protein